LPLPDLLHIAFIEERGDQLKVRKFGVQALAEVTGLSVPARGNCRDAGDAGLLLGDFTEGFRGENPGANRFCANAAPGEEFLEH
jgi:hypothetical protein